MGTKVTQEKPEAACFIVFAEHSKKHQDLGCVCCTQIKQDKLGMVGKL